MTFSLQTKKRAARTAVLVREQGDIPAVLYGPQIQPVSLAIPGKIFIKLYAEAGDSTLIDVVVDEAAPVKALVQEVQYDPIKSHIIHVDFRQIDMKKELTTPIELRFRGESAAVKGAGGTLIKGVEQISIKCLPKDLVGYIEVDISTLKTFADIIHISDLTIPAGITVLAQPETVVAKVNAPLTEDQIKAMEEAGTVKLEDIEVEKKGKKEEEPAAEGEVDAAGAKPKEEAKKKDEGKKKE